MVKIAFFFGFLPNPLPGAGYKLTLLFSKCRNPRKHYVKKKHPFLVFAETRVNIKARAFLPWLLCCFYFGMLFIPRVSESHKPGNAQTFHF